MQDNLCTIYKLAFNQLFQCLLANGYHGTQHPSEANILIVGVCASFEADEKRSLEAIAALSQYGKPLYVIGCMVSTLPRALDTYRKTFRSWEYSELLDEVTPNCQIPLESISLPSTFRCTEDYRVNDPTKHYVGICFGCAYACSYCLHKIGAGNLVSRPQVEIIDQIQTLAGNGTKTIVLTGIDTASYGKDIGSSFSSLMGTILTRSQEGIKFHIAQYNPEEINKTASCNHMVNICSDPKVVDLQLPIQTTSSRLLGLMNRHYTSDTIEDFVIKVLLVNPGLFLRTDIIVGFPTETESEFLDTVAFVARYFKEVAVYRYEHKLCTPINKLGLPLLSRTIVDRRMEQAYRILRNSNVLVHSGGQDIDSLMWSDQRKRH